MKNRKIVSPVISLLLIIVLVGGLAAAVWMNMSQRSTDSRSQASSNDTDCGRITVKVSATGKAQDAKNEVIISQNYGKYYIHATGSDGTPCATAFDAKTAAGQVLSPWVWQKGSTKYAPYASDQQGIARVDIGPNFPQGSYVASFRPHKSTSDWSNQITVIVAPEPTANIKAQTAATFFGKDYITQKPGSIYIFKNQTRSPNVQSAALKKVAFRTLLQMEEKVKLGELTATPWRITKEHSSVYWNVGGNDLLRWFVAELGSAPAALPEYKNWTWAIGHHSYHFSSAPLRNIDQSKLFASYLYQMTEASFPTYALFKDNTRLPYMHDSDKGFISNSGGVNTFANPQMLTSCPAGKPCPNHHWRMRIEEDTVAINGTSYVYNGPAIRVDYYEITPRSNTALLPFVLRESWYYVKGVGIVKIEGKTFNGYPTKDCQIKNPGVAIESLDCTAYSPNALTDSDFFADHMSEPYHVATLDEYFANPTLAATVGKINASTFGATAAISKAQNEGYEVRVSPAITGYLEVRVLKPDGTYSGATKWLWSEKGRAVVTPTIMQQVPAGTYTAQYRVWAPNEVFPTETRVTDTAIPWSNAITVVVQ